MSAFIDRRFGGTAWTSGLPDAMERMGKAMFEKEKVCFSFRLIDMGNGLQVIDESIKTPMDALTPEMQAEYMEVHEQLAFMKMIQKNDSRETERGRKLVRNPLHRLACFCGLA